MVISIFSWMVFGLIVGVIAKLMMPGHDPGGIVVTGLLGIVGALVGGFAGRLLGVYQHGEGAGYMMATLGAIAVLFVYRQFATHAHA